MKAISVRQPWAWLIVHGYKDIENRSWRTNFRGRVLIHASKGMTKREYWDTWNCIELLSSGEHIELPPPEQLERGGIVGSVTIIGCCHPEAKTVSPWHMKGHYGFQLDAPIPLPFIECKGRLGFFDVPDDVASQIRAIAAARADAIKQCFDAERAAAALADAGGRDVR